MKREEWRRERERERERERGVRREGGSEIRNGEERKREHYLEKYWDT